MDKISIKDIKPAEYNPRMISDEDYGKLQKSINKFGLVDPIIVNLKNNVIIGGHQRYKALLDKNVKELQLLRMGDIGYAFNETSFTVPDEIHEKGLNIALNKISGEFVEEKLQPLLEEINLSDFDVEVTGFSELEIGDLDVSIDEPINDKYSTKIQTPEYTIKGEKPDLNELVDQNKTLELIGKIKKSSIPEPVKEFLILSAYRHLKFSYDKIAEYYAHADKETQELMEESALVIIDFDKAISNGFVELGKEISKIIGVDL